MCKLTEVRYPKACNLQYHTNMDFIHNSSRVPPLAFNALNLNFPQQRQRLTMKVECSTLKILNFFIFTTKLKTQINNHTQTQFVHSPSTLIRRLSKVLKNTEGAKVNPRYAHLKLKTQELACARFETEGNHLTVFERLPPGVARSRRDYSRSRLGDFNGERCWAH